MTMTPVPRMLTGGLLLLTLGNLASADAPVVTPLLKSLASLDILREPSLLGSVATPSTRDSWRWRNSEERWSS